MAVRVSRPEAWANDADRRCQARVPSEVSVHTKPELALALRDQARAWGVRYRGGVADADDGDNPNFLAGLEGRQARYVVGVRRAFRVRMGRAARSPGLRAEELLQTVPRWPWRPMRWRQGTKGWRRQKFVAGRCWRVTAEGQRQVGWLVGERTTRGQPAERQSHWSTRSAAATLEALAGYAHRRYAVEPFQEAATGELGWDHDQGRLGPGFHRHAVAVMRAYSLLVWLERRQRRRQPRRGRPPAPFSPSAGSSEALVASGPSRDCTVAAPPRRPRVGHNGSVHGTLLTKDLTERYYEEMRLKRP